MFVRSIYVGSVVSWDRLPWVNGADLCCGGNQARLGGVGRVPPCSLRNIASVVKVLRALGLSGSVTW